RAFLIVFQVIPILDPFEDVPGHVVDPKPTYAFGIGIDGHRPANVLPIVGLFRVEGMAPRVMIVTFRPFSRSLPFRLRREPLAFPLAEGTRISPTHADHWLVGLAQPRIVPIGWGRVTGGFHEFFVPCV